MSGGVAHAVDLTIIAPSSFREFCRVMDELNESVQRYHYDRYKYGDRCYVAFSSCKKLAGSGWLRDRGELQIAENGDRLRLGEVLLLYDFYTRDCFRGRGVYKSLLRFILTQRESEFRSKAMLIYVRRDNVASVKGINSCGFEPIDRVALRTMGVLA
jgi:GNAT superfamily N-acetyltransferase